MRYAADYIFHFLIFYMFFHLFRLLESSTLLNLNTCFWLACPHPSTSPLYQRHSLYFPVFPGIWVLSLSVILPLLNDIVGLYLYSHLDFTPRITFKNSQYQSLSISLMVFLFIFISPIFIFILFYIFKKISWSTSPCAIDCQNCFLLDIESITSFISVFKFPLIFPTLFLFYEWWSYFGFYLSLLLLIEEKIICS